MSIISIPIAVYLTTVEDADDVALNLEELRDELMSTVADALDDLDPGFDWVDQAFGVTVTPVESIDVEVIA